MAACEGTLWDVPVSVPVFPSPPPTALSPRTQETPSAKGACPEECSLSSCRVCSGAGSGLCDVVGAGRSCRALSGPAAAIATHSCPGLPVPGSGCRSAALGCKEVNGTMLSSSPIWQGAGVVPVWCSLRGRLGVVPLVPCPSRYCQVPAALARLSGFGGAEARTAVGWGVSRVSAACSFPSGSCLMIPRWRSLCFYSR